MSTPLHVGAEPVPGRERRLVVVEDVARWSPSGIVTTQRQTKQMASSAMRIPAGTHSRSARPIRCDRSRRALTRDGSGGGRRARERRHVRKLERPYRILGSSTAYNRSARRLPTTVTSAKTSAMPSTRGRSWLLMPVDQLVADARHREDRLDDRRPRRSACPG